MFSDLPFFSFAPAFRRPTRLRISWQTVIERLKIGAEYRSMMSDTPRREFGFDFLLKGDEAQAARSFFDLLDDGRFRFPDWTSACEVSERIDPRTFKLRCLKHLDWRVYSVYVLGFHDREGEEVGISDFDFEQGILTLDRAVHDSGCLQIFPVRVGRLQEIPELPAFNDDGIEFDLRVIEEIESINFDRPFGVLEDWPLLDGVPYFSLLWDDGEEAWQTHVSYSRKGFGVESVYQREREARRQFSLSTLRASYDEVNRLISFFNNRGGRAHGFWFSSDRCNYRLAQDGYGESSIIMIQGHELLRSFENRPGYDRILLRGGFTEELLARVVSMEEDGDGLRVELDRTVPAHFKAKDTAVSIVSFVRFAEDSLNLEFDTDAIAGTRLSFLELSHEYDKPHQPRKPVYLYEISGYVNERWTSFARSITSQGQVFQPADVTHGAIKSKPESIENRIKVTANLGRSNHPLHVFRGGYPLEELQITIYEVQADDLDNRKVVYGGRSEGIDFGERDEISIDVSSAGTSANSETPTAWYEPRCARQFMRPGCEVSESAYRVQGTVVQLSGVVLRIDEAETEAASRGFDDWFLHGRMKIGNEERSIINQSGNLLMVSSPFINASSGDSVELLPGCARTAAHCKLRYDNYGNFGGHPFVPKQNPQLEAVRFNTSIPQGGKK